MGISLLPPLPPSTVYRLPSSDLPSTIHYQMAKRGSSRRWMREHREDDFVKKAERLGYRSRAVFKLQELDRKEHLLRPGMVVVDLGAAPGSWSQYAAQRVGPQGSIIALDMLPMDSLPGVRVIQGDFREDETLQALNQALGGRGVSLVMSDMAPNISGIGVVDQTRAMYLAELALDLARGILVPGGGVLVKVFQGEGFDAFVAEVRQSFTQVRTRKPKASRSRSREVYVLGRGYSV